MVLWNTNSPQNSVKIHDSKFAQNIGMVIFANNSNMLITHTKFIDNIIYSGPFASAVLYLWDSNLVIDCSAFSNNSGLLLDTIDSNVTIRHCELISNNHAVVLGARGGISFSFDHSKFINNTGMWIFSSTNISMIRISHSEFIDNIVSRNLIELAGTKTINITNSYFSDNANTAGCYYRCPPLIYLEGFQIDLYFIKFVNNKADGAGISIQAVNTRIYHSEFINTTGSMVIRADNKMIVGVTHSEFVENSVTSSVLYSDGIMITVKLNEFIQNEALNYEPISVVYIKYYTDESLMNNIFAKTMQLMMYT